MKPIRLETLQHLKAMYPPGTRVRLIQMDDPYTTLKPGNTGTVEHVDCIGTIHVKWDCGSSLGVAYGADQCEKTADKTPRKV